MATNRMLPETWSPTSQTTITMTQTRQPRDERVRIPRCANRTRPGPIQVDPRAPKIVPVPSPLLKSDNDKGYEPPRTPEVVDLAAPSTWPRQDGPPRNAGPRRMASPSIRSQYSARQSEMSFGILGYYTRDVSPLNSPELPPPIPQIDSTIEQFDFGLQSTVPCQQSPGSIPIVQRTNQDASVGASKEPSGLSQDPPAPVKVPRPQHKKGYSLFPTVHDPAQGVKCAAASMVQQTIPPASNITTVPPHQQPDASYRPRKESLSSSIRSRKDSLTSFRSSRRIPLRILSADSGASAKTQSIGSPSTSSPGHSRWSDENVTSPTAVTTPEPRTSFGSMIGRDSVQYPACFFEDDDDERVPLRSKFAWKRSFSLTQERSGTKGKGRFDERKSFGRRVARVLLCASCCG